MKLHASEVAFLQDLARAKTSWTSIAMEAIADPRDLIWSENAATWSKLSSCIRAAGAEKEFSSVVSELLSGLVHSALVSLDGGTALAETTLLTVQDSDGHEFKRFLHEFWPEYSDAKEA